MREFATIICFSLVAGTKVQLIVYKHLFRHPVRYFTEGAVYNYQLLRRGTRAAYDLVVHNDDRAALELQRELTKVPSFATPIVRDIIVESHRAIEATAAQMER